MENLLNPQSEVCDSCASESAPVTCPIESQSNRTGSTEIQSCSSITLQDQAYLCLRYYMNVLSIDAHDAVRRYVETISIKYGHPEDAKLMKELFRKHNPFNDYDCISTREYFMNFFSEKVETSSIEVHKSIAEKVDQKDLLPVHSDAIYYLHCTDFEAYPEYSQILYRLYFCGHILYTIFGTIYSKDTPLIISAEMMLLLQQVVRGSIRKYEKNDFEQLVKSVHHSISQLDSSVPLLNFDFCQNVPYFNFISINFDGNRFGREPKQLNKTSKLPKFWRDNEIDNVNSLLNEIYDCLIEERYINSIDCNPDNFILCFDEHDTRQPDVIYYSNKFYELGIMLQVLYKRSSHKIVDVVPIAKKIFKNKKAKDVDISDSALKPGSGRNNVYNKKREELQKLIDKIIDKHYKKI